MTLSQIKEIEECINVAIIYGSENRFDYTDLANTLNALCESIPEIEWSWSKDYNFILLEKTDA